MLMSGRIIPTIFGKGVDFQGLGHCPLLGLLTVPWNCHGTSGCAISLADWGSRSSLAYHLGPIWFQLVCVVSLGYVILSKIVLCPFPSCYKSTMATSWFRDTFWACENLWNVSNQLAWAGIYLFHPYLQKFQSVITVSVEKGGKKMTRIPWWLSSKGCV